MANLTKTNWERGWVPSEDPINGDPSGLVRADNMQLDEDGVLSLIRGMQQVGGSFSDYVSDGYAKYFGSQEAIYVALNANGHTVQRSLAGDFSDITTIIASGTARACFGDALGNVICCAGGARVKDNGTSNLKALGLQTAGTPTVSAINQPAMTFGFANFVYGAATNVVSGSDTLILGTGFTGQTYGHSLIVDTDSLQGIWWMTFGATDTTNIDTGPASDIGLDQIQYNVVADDPSSVVEFSLTFVLDKDTSDPTMIYNYYKYTWNADQLLQGPSQQTSLNAYRKDFIRYGNDATVDWRHVTAVIFEGTSLSVQALTMSGLAIFGGSAGQLTGTYNYLQVNKNNNGLYLASSPASLPTSPVSVNNGSITITPGTTDNQTTEVWIFRVSAVNPPAGTGAAPVNGQTGQTTFLNNYYRVGVTQPGVPFVDNLSDNDAIQINLVANLFLKSLLSTDVNGITENIVNMEGLYNGFMLYLSSTYLYISDYLNPDAVDSRFTIKAFGDPNERNLWVKRLTNNVLILATTKNNYEITGTLTQLPDGTLDAQIIPIGEAYPSLSQDCAFVNGGIFYVASDGIRVTTGSNSTIISPQLRLLFQGSNRSGVPPVAVIPNNNARYSLAVGKTKLYITLPMGDGTRRLIVYDLIKQNFFLRFTDPEIVFTTPSDRVLVGYNVSTNPNTGLGKLFQIDVGQGLNDSSGSLIEGIPCTFLTVADPNGQPRNRKDTFTLKLVANTGGAALNVMISHDGGSYTQLGTINSSVQTTFYFPLNNVTLGFRYSIQISDVNLVSFFKLYEMTIEYEARPEQVDYLRLIPTNLGSYSRKRYTSFAYVIDTLGNDISFQPYVDNAAAGLPDNINNVTKLTHITYFLSETIGTDIGGIFSGGVFEFYGVNLEETISEKLPVPCQFLIIPANDYGVPNRKRHTSYKFQINTRGQDVRFTPLLDNQVYSTRTYNTQRKTTVEYFFDTPLDTIGIDIGGTLQSLTTTPFEFYGVVVPQTVEKLPDRLDYFVIPPNDYGVPNRKRHSSYKFQINTNGQPVTFTPIIDGQGYSPTIYNTPSRKTVEYFFLVDTIGIDIGGTLEAEGTAPFEFYGVVVPQTVEKLPDRLEYYRIPNNNMGVAARKRIRTIPIVIDTYGQPVIFTPIVDGVLQSNTTVLISNGKTTLYHYFINDVFGTDFGGQLSSGTSSQPFEFYELGQPEDVEVLPVPKKYDQLGPIRFDKIGKIFTLRIKMIMNGTTTLVPFAIYGDPQVSNPTYDGSPLYSGTFPVTPQVDGVYEIQLPKSVNSDVFRLTLGPTVDSFHRYDVTIRVSTSGMESDSKWMPVR